MALDDKSSVFASFPFLSCVISTSWLDCSKLIFSSNSAAVTSIFASYLLLSCAISTSCFSAVATIARSFTFFTKLLCSSCNSSCFFIFSVSPSFSSFSLSSSSKTVFSSFLCSAFKALKLLFNAFEPAIARSLIADAWSASIFEIFVKFSLCNC